MHLDVTAHEPSPAPRGERLWLGQHREAEHPAVEGLGVGLSAGGHGQLDVIERGNPDGHAWSLAFLEAADTRRGGGTTFALRPQVHRLVERGQRPRRGPPVGDDRVVSDAVFPSPTLPAPSTAAVFLGYLDYFRGRIIDKVEALDAGEQMRSHLPSGWTPLQLVKHLTFVEMRWLEWGFAGRSIEDPWGDHRDDRWYIGPTETAEVLVSALWDQGQRTRSIIEGNDLSAVGQPGPRWDGAEPATLERVLFHLVQEHARHLGHLDIVVELANGTIGE